MISSKGLFFLHRMRFYDIIDTGEKMTIQDYLLKLKFTSITPIQQEVFQAFSSKKHLVGLAPTGTGKTHAYVLPILSKLNIKEMHVQALVIVPTNELVTQVEKMLLQADDRFVVKTYYGGANKMREQEWLKKYQPQIVIATPKQIGEYVYTERLLQIHQAKYVVFDEADMMFDEEFMHMIDRFLPAIEHAKLMLFSATLTQAMEPFIKTYFGSYDLIDTSKKHQLKITYKLINIKYQDRMEALLQVIKSINPYCAFIFVSKKENQDLVYERLILENIQAINLNASLGVKKRQRIIEDIQALKYPYVVTSDLAARGLDFKISHVIHYDLPHFLEFFMHRSGRTGRMNDTGEVITFMTVDDHRKIEKLKSKGIPFIPYLLTSKGLEKATIKKAVQSEEEKEALQKIKTKKKVAPNYKKKHAKQVKKIKQEIRRKQYANSNR